MISILSALLLAACSGGPESAPADLPTALADCADLDCRERWVVANWQERQEEVIAAVVGTEDEVEQAALVMALAESELGRSQAMCAALPRSPARVKCNQLNSRLHLVDDQPLLPKGLAREAPGPVSWRLDVNDLPRSPLADVELEVDPCAQVDDPRKCRIRNARVQAGSGNVPKAAAFCHDVEDPKWSAECAFQASEERVRKGDATDAALADAVDLCLMTGTFADNCFGHIPLRLGEMVPPVDTATEADWKRLNAQDKALYDALVSRGAPELAEAVRGLFWAETMGSTYTRAHTITGDPLDHLPEEARPHIRAAAAVAMARTPPPEGTPSLDSIARELNSMLARRGPTREEGSAHDGPWRPRADLWPIDRPGDGAIPAVVFMGSSRRAWAMDDPDADLRIAVLEAWARLNPTAMHLVDEGLADPHPLVVFTAERLKRMQAEFPSQQAPRQGGPPPGQRGPVPGQEGPPTDRGGMPGQVNPQPSKGPTPGGAPVTPPPPGQGGPPPGTIAPQ